jgi:hypothetical protein
VRYPEAVRSLAEDEEHVLTFYAFPQIMCIVTFKRPTLSKVSLHKISADVGFIHPRPQPEGHRAAYFRLGEHHPTV